MIQGCSDTYLRRGQSLQSRSSLEETQQLLRLPSPPPCCSAYSLWFSSVFYRQNRMVSEDGLYSAGASWATSKHFLAVTMTFRAQLADCLVGWVSLAFSRETRILTTCFVHLWSAFVFNYLGYNTCFYLIYCLLRN